ncbi:hypothetical protein N8Z72_02600 [Polaribacter sp.]|nr:hypothetical protein [Polaribacter sp.]
MMVREVSTTGSKKIKTLYKEFNEHFPYLRLKLLSFDEFCNSIEGKTISGLDIEKTLSEVREKKGAGKISFTGRKKIETIEKDFEEIFGLYVQICYTEADGKRYYTTREDAKTLSTLNREKEASGCKKGVWK